MPLAREYYGAPMTSHSYNLNTTKAKEVYASHHQENAICVRHRMLIAFLHCSPPSARIGGDFFIRKRP